MAIQATAEPAPPPAPPASEPARRAYEELAPLYDRFTEDHDYEHWTASLEAIAREHGLSGKRLLDVACGTGKSFLPMLRRGYEVTACDLSPGMLGRARAKCGGLPVRLLVADMRALPRLGEFDLATCLCDGVNYLLSAEDVGAAFRSVAANLRTGGVFLFDGNTLHTYRSIFAGDFCTESDGAFFACRGEAPADAAPGSVCASTLVAFERRDDGSWARSSSHHVQRHHPEELIRARLAAAGLDCLAAYGQFMDGSVERPPDESRHTKIVYVARKPGLAAGNGRR